MAYLAVIPAVLAFVCWVIAAGSALVLTLRHRKEGHDFFWYAMRGYAYFSAENFAPSGAGAHRMMMLGIAGFALNLVLGIALAALGSAAT